jgi:acetyl esterase/lipase
MSKILFIICFIIIAALSLSAQQTVKIWHEKDMTQKEKWSELTAFLPSQPDTSGVSIIICPGGSYFWLDMDNEGRAIARYLNRKGIAAFVLRYRTAMYGNRHPAMIQDLQRSIQMVKENALTYNINPEKVGVMGFSAGGHLAGLAAIYFDRDFLPDEQFSQECKDLQRNKPYFAAMIYPVVSMEDSICHKKSRKNLLGKKYTAETTRKMSLEHNVRPDMPPVFLLHCVGDKTVDYRNSVILAKALTDNNVPHKFLLLEETGHGGHGFGIRPNGKASEWIDTFLKWLYLIKK